MDETDQARRVVLTGGPGAGKTVLLNELARRGYPVAGEAAREIIRRRNRQGLSPRPGPLEFASEILRSDLRQYSAPETQEARLVFFDRGIPDALAMLDRLDQLSTRERQHYLTNYPYHAVFILPPWREIYRLDPERDQTYSEAVEVHDRLQSWYAHCGYEPIAVPPASAEERCHFVLHQLREKRDDA